MAPPRLTAEQRVESRKRRLANQRQYRRQTGNVATARYEKTKRGFLMRAYRNMQSRIAGVQWRKHHLYRGLPLIGRAVFYEWALASATFHRLWEGWVQAGYDRRFTPSVDRIRSECGYMLDNMEWVTHSENSRRGAVSRHYGQRCRSVIIRIGQ